MRVFAFVGKQTVISDPPDRAVSVPGGHLRVEDVACPHRVQPAALGEFAEKNLILAYVGRREEIGSILAPGPSATTWCGEGRWQTLLRSLESTHSTRSSR